MVLGSKVRIIEQNTKPYNGWVPYILYRHDEGSEQGDQPAPDLPSSRSIQKCSGYNEVKWTLLDGDGLRPEERDTNEGGI